MEKINLYADQREEKSKGKTFLCLQKSFMKANDYVSDSMDTWDEEKLRNVVTENARKQKNATDVSTVKLYVRTFLTEK